MTAPTPINLTGFTGATLIVDLDLFRKDANDVKVPVDLTGATLYMTVKNQYVDPDPGLAQINSTGSNADGGIVITDAPNGKATATIFDTVTDALIGPLSLVYDVKCIEASGNESIPIFGRLTIKPAVTRAL